MPIKLIKKLAAKLGSKKKKTPSSGPEVKKTKHARPSAARKRQRPVSTQVEEIWTPGSPAEPKEAQPKASRGGRRSDVPRSRRSESSRGRRSDGPRSGRSESSRRSRSEEPRSDRSEKARRGRRDDEGGSERPPARRRSRSRSQRPRGDDARNRGSAAPSAELAMAHAAWSVDQFEIAPEEGKVRFHDLELPGEIMHAIADLGFQYCTPIQAKVLMHTKAGDNVAGKAQTGTGKTAAFLISIFAQFLGNPRRGEAKPGCPRALVLAPTRELVIQLVKDAQALGKYAAIRSLAVYGGMDYNKQEAEMSAGPVDLLGATPGRLLDFCRRGVIDLSKVEVLVIDEADRMLDMGFIPDVRAIVRRTPRKEERCTMLFSATLTEEVLRLASQWMPDPVICEVDPENVAVDTVNQILYAVPTESKYNLLYNLITKRGMKRVLVFGNRRDATQRVADRLHRSGVACSLLSGAVPQKRRLRILEDFKAGRIQVLVATDVAGRGLHIDDIDHVINFDFPYEPEDYVHRIGRTGRAGHEGTAISFACEDESFIIPEIEEYIGRSLACTVPEDELLVAAPRGKVSGNAPGHTDAPAGRTGGSRGGGRGRSSGGRGRSGGGSRGRSGGGRPPARRRG